MSRRSSRTRSRGARRDRHDGANWAEVHEEIRRLRRLVNSDDLYGRRVHGRRDDQTWEAAMGETRRLRRLVQLLEFQNSALNVEMDRLRQRVIQSHNLAHTLLDDVRTLLHIADPNSGVIAEDHHDPDAPGALEAEEVTGGIRGPFERGRYVAMDDEVILEGDDVILEGHEGVGLDGNAILAGIECVEGVTSSTWRAGTALNKSQA